ELRDAVGFTRQTGVLAHDVPRRLDGRREIGLRCRLLRLTWHSFLLGYLEPELLESLCGLLKRGLRKSEFLGESRILLLPAGGWSWQLIRDWVGIPRPEDMSDRC